MVMLLERYQWRSVQAPDLLSVRDPVSMGDEFSSGTIRPEQTGHRCFWFELTGIPHPAQRTGKNMSVSMETMITDYDTGWDPVWPHHGSLFCG